MPAKLYVVVDAALSPGLQLAQAVHAAFHASVFWPDQIRRWHLESNFLVVLASPDPLAEAQRIGTEFVTVREPDLDYAITAVVFLPSEHVTRGLSNLPLALKEPAMT